MKRLALAVGILAGMSCIVKADSWGQYGQMDGRGVHKSTVMVNNQVNMVIDTGTIMIVSYNVLSTGILSGLQFQEFNSTNSNFGFPVFYGSAPYNGAGVAKYGTDNWTQDNGKYVLLKSTWGWAVTKTGAAPAVVEIKYETIYKK